MDLINRSRIIIVSFNILNEIEEKDSNFENKNIIFEILNFRISRLIDAIANSLDELDGNEFENAFIFLNNQLIDTSIINVDIVKKLDLEEIILVTTNIYGTTDHEKILLNASSSVDFDFWGLSYFEQFDEEHLIQVENGNLIDRVRINSNSLLLNALKLV